MKKLWLEFKKFVSRGSVVDLAVGMVIGAAFTAIVTSLVNDLLMPVIALISGKPDLTSLVWVIKKTPVLDDAGAAVFIDGIQQFDLITINYGNFLQAILNFLLIALALFAILKIFNAVKDHAEKSRARLRELSEKMDEGGELSEKDGKWFRKRNKKAAAEAAAEAAAPEPAPAPAPEPTTTEKLLAEIVELLKAQNVADAQAALAAAEVKTAENAQEAGK